MQHKGQVGGCVCFLLGLPTPPWQPWSVGTATLWMVEGTFSSPHDIVVSEFSSPVGLPDARVRRWGKQSINYPALHNLLPLRVEVQLSPDPHGYEGQWVHGVVTSLTLHHVVKPCCCQVGLEAQHATDKTLP